MGFVSALVINNDLLHCIKEDKDFGDKVHEAVLTLSRHGESAIFSGMGCTATAVMCHHASQAKVLIVGGNTLYQKITGVYLGEHDALTQEVRLLKSLAENMVSIYIASVDELSNHQNK